MGIHWNCLAADKSSQTFVASPTGSVPAPIPDLDSGSDSPRDFNVKVIYGVGNQLLVSLDDSMLRAFTIEELRAATFNFSENLILGSGGFGNVYRGWLKEQLPSEGTKNRQIAVKRFHSTSFRGREEFLTEITILERLSHPNIITLLGFCHENNEQIIVYEYMEKRSLDYHLFTKKTERVLSWEIRLKIAIQMAEALSYLHSFEEPTILRDFKPSNILLDKSYNAKISDFGIAICAHGGDQDVLTSESICGTVGYMDPHYAWTGELYVKSDVYGFGVVLVELLTGLKSYNLCGQKGQSRDLGKWAQSYLNDRFKLRGVMDSRLKGKYVTVQASEIAMLALSCLVSHPKHRPSMKEVAETLGKIQAHANQKHLVMCWKCHKAGHYSRFCDKISHVKGNSKLPNATKALLKNNKSRNNHPRKTTAIGGISKLPEARNATKKKKTSSSKMTVQSVKTRSEASSVRTSTFNNGPRKIVASNSKLPDASNATKKEKISAAKAIVQQGKKRNEANEFGTSTTRRKGPRKTTPSNSNLLDANSSMKNKKSWSIQSRPQQGSQRDGANGIATKKPWNNHPRKTTAIGGNSKLPEARNAMKKEKTSSSKLTVQHVKTRSEASGARTSTCNNGPRKIIANNSKPPDATNAMKKEISAAKSIVQQGKKRNEANAFGTSTTRSKGPRKITTSNSEEANASNVGKKEKACAPYLSTIQQDTKRKVARDGGTCTKSARQIAGYK